MGAGQIGGIATLLDIDFHNAAGFYGEKPDVTEGQHVDSPNEYVGVCKLGGGLCEDPPARNIRLFSEGGNVHMCNVSRLGGDRRFTVVMFFSHAMMFCVGSLIEAHVVLTAATCVYGERYKFDVVAGTHRFLEYTGITRQVQHLCLHKGYNHSSNKYEDCETDNLALLVLNKQFQFSKREYGTDFVINRIRYGVPGTKDDSLYQDTTCRYYGWGSRRNGFLIPLLIHIRRVKVVILPQEKCLQLFNYNDKYLCIQQHQCRSEKFGALCPDDVGSVIECSGFARGIMTSRLVDRPCGVGFLDLSKYSKFLMCGVDDSRDVVDHDIHMAMEFTTAAPPPTPTLITVAENETEIP